MTTKSSGPEFSRWRAASPVLDVPILAAENPPGPRWSAEEWFRRRVRRPSLRQLAVVGVVLVIAGAYTAFVAHYALNVPFEDDWSEIPLLHSAVSGHLSFGSLWALHDENRMLVPNLVYVATGVWAHDDLRVLNALSVATFIVSFIVYLVLLRAYARRPLTPFAVLVLGLIWFSLADWNNALWGFQVAWYLIVLFLIVMIGLLTTWGRSTTAFVFAVLTAVLASFSFVHGLCLWPVGLVCLLWTSPRHPSEWDRRKRLQVLVWIGAAVGTVIAALWGYTFFLLGCNTASGFQFSCSGSVTSYVLAHPWRLIEFVLVNIGEVVPNANESTLWLNGLLGAALLVVAVIVTIRSIRHRADGRSCLPVALICFGLLCDTLVAAGRVQFLTATAPSSTYTMANLIILVALVSYAWVEFPVSGDRASLVGRRIVVGVVLVALAGQVVLASQAGVTNARKWDTHLTIGARLVVNLDRIPASQQGCYALYGELAYLVFNAKVTSWDGFEEARQDRLTVFTPVLYRKYRAEGLPAIAPCKP
jgi:hypothetical protein